MGPATLSMTAWQSKLQMALCAPWSGAWGAGRALQCPQQGATFQSSQQSWGSETLHPQGGQEEREPQSRWAAAARALSTAPAK